MFRFAQDNGFNKITLGHHQDDIIHTTMLNTFFEGSFSTMPAVKKLDKMPLTIIRPLCLEQEKTCPHERETNRTQMKRIFEEIERNNPEARYSVWHALQKDGKLVE
mgnify:CR=1 FL=1